MTNQQKVEAYAMRLDGCTLQEVANKFGVTREYIRQITPPVGNYGKKRSSYDSCVYPNIANWLYDNRYSYTRFAKYITISYRTLYSALTGSTMPSKSMIDSILAATGMTYEEAFYRPEKED